MKALSLHSISILLLSSMMVGALGTACSTGNYSGNRAQEQDDDSSDKDFTDPEAFAGMQALGVKSATQIYLSLQKVTGVTPESSIRTYFNNNRASLPAVDKAEALSISNINAYANLAERFCNRIAMDSTTRSNFFAGTSFGDTLSSSSSSAYRADLILATSSQREELARIFVERFWVEAAVAPSEYTAYVDEVKDLIDTLLEGENPDHNATLRVIRASCVAPLASAALTFH